MFTGLIEAVGRVARVEVLSSGRRLRIATSLTADATPGDSIAVNGVCLTATAVDAAGFEADLSPETLRVTTLLALTEGRGVNLERPVRADARLGGHFVLGHVDAVGRITALRHEEHAEEDCAWLEVDVPAGLTPLVVPKGSIAIDGISLTVASLEGTRVGVQIIPFTLSHTALGEAGVGDAVNLEADVIGKYVARLLEARRDAAAPAVTPV